MSDKAPLPQAAYGWWEDHYSRIDKMMDVLMRRVGAENEQPSARDLTALLWEHGLVFANKEQVIGDG